MTTNPLFKKKIEDIVPYEAGRPIEEVKRQLRLKRVVKLASNENPLGSSPKAVKAIERAVREVHLYPDGGSYYLKQKLAEIYGIEANQFILGNGSNEIIELLARGFLSDGDNVISSEKTFLVYPLIAQTCGAEFISVPMKELRYDLNGILEQINDKTKLVFVANPNNPTGTYVAAQEVRSFLSKVPRNVIVCMDEAYIDFVEAGDFPRLIELVRENQPNLILLRTFSKSMGLAGLRIGFGMASREIVGYLEKVRQPFNVNRLAQIAACAALDDRAFLQKSKKLVSDGRRYLYREFTKLGLEYIPSQANFVLVHVKRDGREIFDKLLKRGIIVRPMKAYGLNSYLRVSIGTQTELELFIRELRKVLSE